MSVYDSFEKRRVLESILHRVPESGLACVGINTSVEGVECPDLELPEGQTLNVSLSWAFQKPMQINMEGISALLSFSGSEHMVRAPWDAIAFIRDVKRDELVIMDPLCWPEGDQKERMFRLYKDEMGIDFNLDFDLDEDEDWEGSSVDFVLEEEEEDEGEPIDFAEWVRKNKGDDKV